MYRIDINADVGEGCVNEAEIFPFISSCNIACGGHAGDSVSIREVAILASEHGLKIGAHPSYPDRENFGRRSLELPADKLILSLRKQLQLFFGILEAEKIKIHHIKAHGALYNDLSNDMTLAGIYLEALEPFMEGIAIVAAPGSALQIQAQKSGYRVLTEAFLDRAYLPTGHLVSRNQEGALIQDKIQVLNRLVDMVIHHRIKSNAGVFIEIKADTFCIHGDTPAALEILMYLDQELPHKNIRIQ